ncbi:hypothetical protein PAXRUDRAFT_158009 [Paxillus rubicundulus Ve08.2h10]|uniref:Retrotransposon Copia-like N-terminal domain-containing protein n=1 Tax=Paxillus rubicundulus Ve08.2h10 TaxID=930991 RepID=A0A0D0DH38_9AGAM|nr:hypothetical protein PAXRUDRAFT_158009 [Paxillus rubicundulus Ve08.2h10]
MATAPQAVQPTYVTLAPTQPNVKAIRISQSDLEKIAVLDRGMNNWATWSDAMQNLLLLNHGGAYILGTLPRPNDTGSAVNWDLNNLCIIAALHTRSTPEEQAFLRPYMNAHLAWSALCTHHEQIGPIAQTLLIQKLLQVQYRKSEHFSTTSLVISEDVRRVFSMGLPTEDAFTLIMMMNAMSEELPSVRDHIADCIVQSTTLQP